MENVKKNEKSRWKNVKGEVMREIKFRGKLKEHFGDKNGNVVLQKGTWIYGGIVFDENRVWIDTKYYGEIIVDKDTIGQYTELHDKNGTEIYEGDVIELNEEGRQLFGTKEHPSRKYQLVGFKDGAFMTGRSDVDCEFLNTYLWILKNHITVVRK